MNIEIDMDDFVKRSVRQLTRDELYDLICRLDLAVAEYDFTERLRDHFISEIKRSGSY